MRNNQSSKRLRHWRLYVLKLENDKWYVGITTKTPEERFLEHKNNIRSAAWTREHFPVRIHDYVELGNITSESAHRRENNATLKYMRKYGINNVRGGEFTEVEDYVIKGSRFFRKDMWEMFKSGSIGMLVMFLFLLAAIILGKL